MVFSLSACELRGGKQGRDSRSWSKPVCVFLQSSYWFATGFAVPDILPLLLIGRMGLLYLL